MKGNRRACLLAVACLGLAAPVSAQEPRLRATWKGHTNAVRSVAFSRDGKLLAAGSEDGTVQLWDIPAAKQAGD